MKIKIIILTLINICQIYLQNLLVISPETVRDAFTRQNQLKKGQIIMKHGRFGEIPYGTSINGYTYLHYRYNPDLNDWCDPRDFSSISTEFVDSESHFSPIVLANSLNCSFTQKAKNVQAAKGAALVIYTTDSNYAEEKNVDDEQGIKVTIPTVIVNNDAGNILTNNLGETSSNKILLSMSFKAIVEGDTLNMQMFFRSDQIKALHFFKEFERYYKKLGNKLKFTPVYKYSECSFCKSEDTLVDTPIDSCFKNGKFCGASNLDLKVKNGRLVLLENLRQKCIYSKYSLRDYWSYMIKFSDMCADINWPTFTKACATETMDLIGIDNKTVENCMKDALNKEDNTLLSEDTELYKKYKVTRFPTIMFNEVKYKSSWLAKHVFNSVCSGFFADKSICTDDVEIEEVSVNDSEIGFGVIALIIFVILSCMALIVYCYRRLVNKTIDESIEDRIFKQTKDSVGNYSKMEKNILA